NVRRKGVWLSRAFPRKKATRGKELPSLRPAEIGNRDSSKTLESYWPARKSCANGKHKLLRMRHLEREYDLRLDAIDARQFRGRELSVHISDHAECRLVRAR